MIFRPSRFLAGVALVLAGGACASACRDAPVREELPPQGVLRGTFLYSGPPPCTELGHVLGAGVILLFDEKLLPPPEGLATRSSRIQAIGGDDLFADASRRLTFNPDGSRWCPPGNTAPIFATASWTLSPVEAGGYQARAFFDREGTFQPGFRFSNLPQKGDITGGSIDNINQVLAGQAPPAFTRIVVGVPDGNGVLKMPALGAFIDNITVAVAAPQTVERPFFHVSGYALANQPKTAEEASAATVPPLTPGTPTVVEMPADFHLGSASSTVAQKFLYLLELTAGVADGEIEAATKTPFFLRVKEDPTYVPVPVAAPRINVFRFDVNRDGVIDGNDLVVGSNLARALAPLVSLQKLDATDPIRRTAQATPRIISSAITMNDQNLLSLAAYSNTTPDPQTKVYAAIRPTNVCVLDPTKADGETIIVTPFETTVSGSKTIEDLARTKADIATLLRRTGPVTVIYGCLPPGDFTINAINEPDINGFSLGGQAWTVPNESGVCMPGEAAVDATNCGSRPRLVSQDSVFRIGKPNDAAFCNANAYTTDTGADGKALFRANCLNATEQEAFDKNALFTTVK